MLKARTTQSCCWEWTGKGPRGPSLVELGPSANHSVQTNFRQNHKGAKLGANALALSGSCRILGGAPTLFLSSWASSPDSGIRDLPELFPARQTPHEQEQQVVLSPSHPSQENQLDHSRAEWALGHQPAQLPHLKNGESEKPERGRELSKAT